MYHYGGNNPVKYTDPDGRDIGDWQNNGDGTWTVISEGATLWDVWGADAYKVTGLSEAEAKNIQVGQTFGKKNNPKTPVGLAVLDKTISIADSGVGVALGEIELAYANALKPFVSQKFNNLNIPEGVITGFRSPNSVYAQELRQFANSLRNISNTLFIIGIGIGLADSIYCGVSNHSWEAGLKRAGRYATTIFVGFAVTYIGSALGGPWTGAILGFGASMYVDSWFEKKGW